MNTLSLDLPSMYGDHHVTEVRHLLLELPGVDRLEVDDTVGFWRVVHVEEPRQVHLIAEMKVPGIAALEFDVRPEPGNGGAILTHTAKFKPRGPFGHLYWWLMVPMHSFVFGSMINNMVAEAERLQRE